MSSNLPTIVRLPANPLTDLTAVNDRQTQLAILTRQQKRTIRMGYLVLALFFGGLGGWAAYTPLAGAIMGQGEIKVDGSNKPVQHYGGGIVREILVKDGQLVQQGDVLLRLDETREKATAEIMRSRLRAAQVQEARLLAQRDGRPEITFPPEIAATEDPEIALLIEAQQNIFEALREATQSQVAILSQRVEQLNEEIVGLRAQLTGVKQQLALVDEEVSTVQALFDEGLVAKPRLLSLKRQQAGLVGQKGNFEAGIARTEQRINETHLQIQSVRDRAYGETVEELRRVQNEIKDLRQQKVVSEAADARMAVTAPITGYVQGMAVSGTGQVVANGQKLMEIVPKDQPMIVELKLKPDDIDEIQVGQVAEVKLTIYSFRTFNKPIDGVVSFVAVDRSEPQGLEYRAFPSGYYKVKVRINEETIAKYAQSDNIQLFPGSPAMVIVPTIPRSALEYLLGPLLQGLDKAFREE